MTRQDVLEKLVPLMRIVFEDPALSVEISTTSDDIAAWDSTNHVMLMIEIETEFGVRFEPEEITAPQNIGELVDLIEAKLS